MHFRISKSAQKFFDNIINFSGSHGAEDKNKFLQFDVYYCCALIGMAAVELDEDGSDLSDMVENIQSNIPPVKLKLPGFLWQRKPNAKASIRRALNSRKL